MAIRSLLILALGGEGGGVLADWLVHAAHASGLPVQATSVPGVAQRTGATSYYLEFLDAAPRRADARPVFALTPTPGAVDVVLSSELLETGRALERGFVDPARTLLITARHRVLTTHEKLAMGDGRYDEARLLAAAQAMAQRCLALPLREITQRHGTVISAVMFGALAGSGALPWPRATCEAAIRAGGVGVDASLAGFAEAFDAVQSAMPATASPAAPAARDAALARTVDLGAERLRDYQDDAYAARFRARVGALESAALGTSSGDAADAVHEAARNLALWMSYEDVIRVADLKTRASRLARVREEAQAGPTDLVTIAEHLKPGLAELADIAPRALGERMAARVRDDAPVGARGRGMTLRTTTISGFAMLRVLASLKGLRPRSLRFAREDAAIERWLDAMRALLPRHAGVARQVAELPRLRKGYSDTLARGLKAYERIEQQLVTPLVAEDRAADDAAAAALRTAIDAALADPEHRTLDRQLGPAPVAERGAAQPVHFHPRPASAANPEAQSPRA